MSEFVVHTSDTRGRTNSGWLNMDHSFSFADYYDPERIFFGVLRVLNNIMIAPERDLSNQIYFNVEHIIFVLKGQLLYRDNLNNTVSLQENDVLLISAGSGIAYEEINESKTDGLQFLHIWIFPSRKNTSPHINYRNCNEGGRENRFQLIVSPEENDDVLRINQNAWLYLADLDVGKELLYELNDNRNGVYVFVISGSLSVESQMLSEQDGMEIWNIERIKLFAMQKTRILLIEVPLETDNK